MLEAALRAVNQHRARSMAPFVAGSLGSFQWTDSRAHDWKADVLPVPGDAAGPAVYLAVFHTFHTCESDGDHVYRLVQPTETGRAGWKLGQEIPETTTLGLRIRDHAIDATVILDTRTLMVHDTATVERAPIPSETRDNPPFALLRINEDYRIRSLRVSGLEGEAAYEQAGGVIAFIPPPTDRFTLSMDYSGRPNHGNGDFIHDDEAVLVSYWYPHIARLPATLSLTATAPAGWTPIGQGEPIMARVNADGSQTMSWRNDVSTSFFTLDMGRYRITNRQWRGRLLSAYLLEPRPDVAARTARESLDCLQESLAFYEKTFGAFPYRRYALVETRGPFNGALEAYSFATFGPRTLPEFVPHELSHTWWGGLVPCAYTRSMWNEAFANYSDYLFQRSAAAGKNGKASETSAVHQRRADRKRASSLYESAAVSLAYDTEDDVQNAIGYGKGAQVLRVLEDQIGQELMLASMRAFLNHHRRGEVAEWAEFETAVAQTTGEDLHWFFTQWLERTGVPRIAISNITFRADGRTTLIEGRLRQVGPLYRVKLPIVVDLRSGGVIRQMVEIREADTPFTLRVAGSPERLQVDPDASVPLAPAADAAQAKSDPLVYDFP